MNQLPMQSDTVHSDTAAAAALVWVSCGAPALIFIYFYLGGVSTGKKTANLMANFGEKTANLMANFPKLPPTHLSERPTWEKPPTLVSGKFSCLYRLSVTDPAGDMATDGQDGGAAPIAAGELEGMPPRGH